MNEIISWLGIYNLFQTFDDLDCVKDKPAEVQALRQMLDAAAAEAEEELLPC